jgi:hypothetical protein
MWYGTGMSIDYEYCYAQLERRALPSWQQVEMDYVCAVEEAGRWVFVTVWTRRMLLVGEMWGRLPLRSPSSLNLYIQWQCGRTRNQGMQIHDGFPVGVEV